MSQTSPHYSTLSGHHATEMEPVTWYWQCLAYLSSWLILGGYLALPALTMDDPGDHAHMSVTALIIVTTACLAAGFSLTPLVVFATPKNTPFHINSVYLPALSSCSLGFLAHVLTTALSEGYDIASPASIIGAVLGVVSTLIYALCSAYASGRVLQRSRQTHFQQLSDSSQLPLTHYRSRSSSQPPAPDRIPSIGSEGTHWSTQSTTYQYPGQSASYLSPSRYETSFHRPLEQVSTTKPIGAFDTGSPIGPVHILPHGSSADRARRGDMVEEELTRQQMLNLLMQGQQGQGPLASSKTTFRIELPRGGLERPESIIRIEPAELDRSNSIFTSEQLDLASPAVAAAAARAAALADDRTPTNIQGTTFEKSLPSMSSSSTVKSRDDRRREIEMGLT